MQCPVCTNTQLVMSDRQGIEIDYCPQCRGVWLDRGELDKIIERSAVMPPVQQRSERFDVPQERHGHEQHSFGRQGYYKDDHHRRKKKEGFLSDLFDFD